MTDVASLRYVGSDSAGMMLVQAHESLGVGVELFENACETSWTGSSCGEPLRCRVGSCPEAAQIRHRRSGPRQCDCHALHRITVEPNKIGGVSCVRGLRIPVATVVGMVAEGMTVEEILAYYPDLEAGDITEALQYAAAAVRERELPLRRGA